MKKDTYKTIVKYTEEALFKDRNSKFIGVAFPVDNEEDVKLNLSKIKAEHHAARHWCYAYQLGTDHISFRANDDGEPNNSAGMPIYGQIQSFDITNVLIVVIRYYGGIKLGVGGLINAYRTAAKLAIESSIIIEKTIDQHFQIQFDYKHMNTVMRIIKEKRLEILNQTLEMDCKIEIAVRKNEAKAVFDQFSRVYEVKIKTL